MQMLTLYTPHNHLRITVDQFWPLNGVFSNVWFHQVRNAAAFTDSFVEWFTSCPAAHRPLPGWLFSKHALL
jgi:hypothetical protein